MQYVLLGNNKYGNGLSENKEKRKGGGRRRRRKNQQSLWTFFPFLFHPLLFSSETTVLWEVVGWGWNNQHSTQTASLIITLIWHGSSWTIIDSLMTLLTPSLTLFIQDERKESEKPFSCLLCYELIIFLHIFTTTSLLLSTLKEWRIVSFAASLLFNFKIC